MIAKSTTEIDWSATTWAGSRRHQHQEFYAMPFSEKLKVVEEICDLARTIARQRLERGEPVVLPGGRVIRSLAELGQP